MNDSRVLILQIRCGNLYAVPRFKFLPNVFLIILNYKSQNPYGAVLPVDKIGDHLGLKSWSSAGSSFCDCKIWANWLCGNMHQTASNFN